MEEESVPDLVRRHPFSVLINNYDDLHFVGIDNAPCGESDDARSSALNTSCLSDGSENISACVSLSI